MAKIMSAENLKELGIIGALLSLYMFLVGVIGIAVPALTPLGMNTLWAVLNTAIGYGIAKYVYDTWLS